MSLCKGGSRRRRPQAKLGRKPRRRGEPAVLKRSIEVDTAWVQGQSNEIMIAFPLVSSEEASGLSASAGASQARGRLER